MRNVFISLLLEDTSAEKSEIPINISRRKVLVVSPLTFLWFAEGCLTRVENYDVSSH